MEKQQNEGQWWSFYAVRYAQGTVIGAIIVFFLLSQNPILKNLLFIPVQGKDFGLSHLVLLGVYGIAYCYISSAPILVMHAARSFIFKKDTPYSFLQVFLLFIGSMIAAFFISPACNDKLKFLSLTLYFLIISMQLYLLVKIQLQWNVVIHYCNSLVHKRRDNIEYVESYRHIREHGNSFLIVIYQLCLALPLYAFTYNEKLDIQLMKNVYLICFFWVLPPALIWFYGNKLEYQLTISDS
ncbi:hypothetical protein [Aeromonas jandaei]|uniref:hypothetical protein n=1 Tax=Aeromonas jandaei TaxID=650 RepID=UPI001ADDA0FA|nr:hypothetical protein [Aeromonas jandaei]QTL92778.1 hypothetical protein AjGTCBM29_00613 [Aeromonas jandaei]